MPVALLALSVLAAAAPRLLPDQVALLSDRLANASSFKVRIQAALILGAGGGAAADEPLRRALQFDSSGPVRAAAALGLADLDGPAALPALVSVLDDDDAFVREEAEKALSDVATRVGAPIVKPLASALTTAPEPARPALLRLLGKLGEPAADAVVGMLGDTDAGVEAAARAELSVFPRPIVDRALARALSGGSFAVRAAAAQMIGERGDAAALAALAGVLADPAELPEVQAAARRAIEALRGSIDGAAEARQAAGAPLPADRVRALILVAARGGADAQAACEKALTDESESVRAAAVSALADIGDRQALPALRRLLTREGDAPLGPAVQAAIRRLERRQPAR